MFLYSGASCDGVGRHLPWIAFLVAGLFAGCSAPADRPAGAADWSSLGCDEEGPTWIGGGVAALGFWSTEVSVVAEGFSNATGQVLAQHRAAGTQKHQWSIFENGTLKGDVEAQFHSMQGWGEWRLTSGAGFPSGEDPAVILDRLLHGLDPLGQAQVNRTDVSEAGIRTLAAWQTYQGKGVIDPFTGYGAVTGYHTERGGSWIFVRPLYDLSTFEVRVTPEQAQERALGFWACARGGDVIVDQWAWAVVHDTLAYAIDVDERAAASLGCIPPVLVDAASGAILGQATTAVCAIPEDAPI